MTVAFVLFINGWTMFRYFSMLIRHLQVSSLTYLLGLWGAGRWVPMGAEWPAHRLWVGQFLGVVAIVSLFWLGFSLFFGDAGIVPKPSCLQVGGSYGACPSPSGPLFNRLDWLPVGTLPGLFIYSVCKSFSDVWCENFSPGLWSIVLSLWKLFKGEVV